MKKLLLTSAMVAVSGAALAEVTWSVTAEIGWRSHDIDGIPQLVEDYYADVDLDIEASADLGNGISATLSYGAGYDDFLSGDVEPDWDDFPTLVLSSSYGSLTLGDIDHAAHDFVDDYNGDIADDFFHEGDDNEFVARADTTYAGFELAASTTLSARQDWYEVQDTLLGNTVSKGDISVAARGQVSMFKMLFAYEQNDVEFRPLNSNDVLESEDAFGGDDNYSSSFAIGAGFESFGADVLLTYASMSADLPTIGYDGKVADAIGLTATYEFSNFELGFDVAQYTPEEDYWGTSDSVTMYDIYASGSMLGADVKLGYEDSNTDDDTDGNQGFYIDASYEYAGAVIRAGYHENEENLIDDGEVGSEFGAAYFGVEYNLSDNAQIFASWSQGDEIGDPEYNLGSTVGVSMTF